MSRSRRRGPFRGVSNADSEKADKQAANRRHRRINRQLLAVAGESACLRLHRETSCVWCMAKDTKRRFDPAEWPRWMRK